MGRDRDRDSRFSTFVTEKTWNGGRKGQELDLEFRHHARWGKHAYISFATGRSSNAASARSAASADDQLALPQALREDASGKNVDAILGLANHYLGLS
jgi:hypothetical protein